MTLTTSNRFFGEDRQGSVKEEIAISYFTDPLCAWSWAFEPQWVTLLKNNRDRVSVTYHMGGLIPDWKTFTDTVNAVDRPQQMGPVWMHIAQTTQVKIDPLIWMRDPPSSSYPACIAFKCAERQSDEFGALYLSMLREAVMLFGRNISKSEILLDLAANPALELLGFDKLQFKEDLFNGFGIEAFRRDLQLVQQYRFNRFPTLIIRRKDKASISVSGFKTTAELQKLFDE